MSIVTQQYDLVPIRKDGQAITGNISISAGGGSSSSGGGTTAAITYSGSSSISVSSGYTITAIFGSTCDTVACGSHLHTGVYLPVNNPTATGTLCAPIGNFATCITTPILLASTCMCSPVAIGSTCVSSPVMLASSCVCSPLVCAVNFTLQCDAGTAVYTSGFAGSGWKLDNTTSSYDLTVDNLNVRNAMTVYQLDINKINAIGGSIVVSPANGTVLCTSGTKLYFDEDGTNKQIQFQIGDIIKAQQWTGRAICSYIGRVCAVNHSSTLGSAYVDMVSTCTGWANMKAVQFGSCCDATRQNLLYLTASDSCNPYLSIMCGVTDGTTTGKERVRLGNLAGITDACFGGSLSGYGLYSDNIYLKGCIVIAGGCGYSNLTDKPTTLAGIDSTSATKLAGIEAGATLGATSAQVTAIAAAACTACWANISSIPAPLATPSGAGLFLNSTAMGYYCGGAWQTCIDSSGNAKFANVVEFGTGTAPINLGNGYGAIAIKGNEIWENTQSGVGTLIINYRGYQGGCTQARVTAIGNGCGSSVATFANSGVEVFTGLRIDGNTLGIGTINSSSTMTATNFILSSDERQKENIQALSIAPVNVEYKKFNMKNEPEQVRFGVVAQDLIKTNPELVRTDKDGMLSVSYFDLLIREVANLKCQVKALQLDLNYMRNYNC
jgi:hypothetical protein